MHALTKYMVEVVFTNYNYPPLFVEEILQALAEDSSIEIEYKGNNIDVGDVEYIIMGRDFSSWSLASESLHPKWKEVLKVRYAGKPWEDYCYVAVNGYYRFQRLAQHLAILGRVPDSLVIELAESAFTMLPDDFELPDHKN